MSTWRIGFLSIAARWWAVVALATGAGGLLAYLYGSGDSPTYEAEAKLLVTVPEAELSALQSAGELAPTYAELVRSTPVLQRTVEALGGRVVLGELRENVRGESDRDTRLLTVRARSGDPEVAVLIANEVAAQLVREASGPPVVPADADSTLRTRLGVVEPASDADRIRPQRLLLMQFGAVAGFFLAIALAVFVDSRRRTVRDEDDLAELTRGGVVLGTVDGGPLSRPRRRALGKGGAGRGGNSYRRLTELLVSDEGEDVPRSLLVVGAQRDTGSGSVAANLAASYADTGARVVLADLGSKLEAARLLGMSGRDTDAPPEKSGALRQDGIVLDRFVSEARHAPLLMLPRGGLPPSLDADEARGLVELMQRGADVLVIHAGHLPRSLTLARAADVTILVARRGRTRRDSVTSTLESLELARAKFVGTLLNTSRRGA